MRIKYIFILLIGFLLLEGCYKDDLEDCPIMLHVYFESIMEKSKGSDYKYENVTDQLDLYLYDQGGNLTEKFSYSRNELELMGYQPVLPIRNFGDYTLIALVNGRNSFNVESNNMEAFRVSIKKDDKDTVKTRPSNLHHAYKNLHLPFTGVINQYDTLDLYKNTNHINLDISFKGGSFPEYINLYTYLGGNNGSSNYRNICLPNDYTIYTPNNTQKVADHLKQQFTTMLMWLESDLTLFIEEEVEGVKTLKCELNIVKELANSKEFVTNEDLMKEDIFNIILVLDNDYTVLKLQINDWEVIKMGEDI